ncbi:hypothetical protein D3C87_2042370 [compost metagenome]
MRVIEVHPSDALFHYLTVWEDAEAIRTHGLDDLSYRTFTSDVRLIAVHRKLASERERTGDLGFKHVALLNRKELAGA